MPLWKFFSAGCFDGMNDTSTGFYGVCVGCCVCLRGVVGCLLLPVSGVALSHMLQTATRVCFASWPTKTGSMPLVCWTRCAMRWLDVDTWPFSRTPPACCCVCVPPHLRHCPPSATAHPQATTSRRSMRHGKGISPPCRLVGKTSASRPRHDTPHTHTTQHGRRLGTRCVSVVSGVWDGLTCIVFFISPAFGGVVACIGSGMTYAMPRTAVSSA